MIYFSCVFVMFSQSSTFSTSSFPVKQRCKNNPVMVKTYRLSSNKNISPSEEQWGELKTKRSEEWRAPRRAGWVSSACFGSGSFPPTRHWGPRRVDVPRWHSYPVSDGERGAADENSAFVFLDGKTRGEAVNVSLVYRDGADSFPGWRDGTVKILTARIYTSSP